MGPGRDPNPSFALLTWLLLFFSRDGVGAATTRGMAICRVKGQRSLRPKRWRNGSPAARTWALTGALWSKAAVTIDGTPRWNARRFDQDVERADAAA